MPDIARLKVAIDEVTPPVLRRVEVPVMIRLDDLHFVLHIAIAGQNCHPFEFRIGGQAWGLLDRDDPGASRLAAETATLADLLALGSSFRYDYVYGEDWSHTVELEAVVAAAPRAGYPRLGSAGGACPPSPLRGAPGDPAGS